MIKVNLLYDRQKAKQESGIIEDASVVVTKSAFEDIFGDDESVRQGDNRLGIVFKIAIMLGFTIALYYYERMQIRQNQNQIAVKQMEAEEIRSLLEAKRGTVKDLELLKQRFSDEREFIDATRKELITRMHFVRGLDSIQTAVVPNLWLTSVSYNDGVFKIDGQSFYKADLDNFHDNLSKVSFFNKAIITKDSGSKLKTSEVYEFSILAEIKKEALGGV